MASSGIFAIVNEYLSQAKLASQGAGVTDGSTLDAKRELAVIGKIARGSFINKAILVSSAVAVSAVAPWAVAPVMFAGGTYLCTQGVQTFLQDLRNKPEGAGVTEFKTPEQQDAEKVKKALKSDFRFSAGIVAVAVGAIAAAPILTQLAVLGLAGIAVTGGIYGVAQMMVKQSDRHLKAINPEAVSTAAKLKHNMAKNFFKIAPTGMKIVSKLCLGSTFFMGGGAVLQALPAILPLLKINTLAAGGGAGAVTSMTTVAGGITGVITGVLATPVVGYLEKRLPAIAKWGKTLIKRKDKENVAEAAAPENEIVPGPGVTPALPQPGDLSRQMNAVAARPAAAAPAATPAPANKASAPAAKPDTFW